MTVPVLMVVAFVEVTAPVAVNWNPTIETCVQPVRNGSTSLVRILLAG